MTRSLLEILALWRSRDRIAGACWHQPWSRFREKPCLKGLRCREMEQVTWHPALTSELFHPSATKGWLILLRPYHTPLCAVCLCLPVHFLACVLWVTRLSFASELDLSERLADMLPLYKSHEVSCFKNYYILFFNHKYVCVSVWVWAACVCAHRGQGCQIWSHRQWDTYRWLWAAI